MTNAAASYVALDGGEPFLMTAFKYEFLHKADPVTFEALEPFHEQLTGQAAASQISSKCHSFQDILQLKLAPSVLDLRPARNAAFAEIDKLIHGPPRELHTFIKAVKRALRKSIREVKSVVGEGDEFAPARTNLGIVRRLAKKAKEHIYTDDHTSTLERVNDLLRCGAHAELTKVQAGFALGLVAKAGTNELARAHNWQGTATNRISARRARMYSLSSV